MLLLHQQQQVQHQPPGATVFSVVKCFSSARPSELSIGCSPNFDICLTEVAHMTLNKKCSESCIQHVRRTSW
ncbi:MAG: hypothetical protein ACTILB_13765, partial [Brevibacterium aurantiacum]